MRLLKNRISIIIILISITGLLLINMNHHKWEREGVIEFDIKSYYSYLPASFIYKDMRLNFTDTSAFLMKKMDPVYLVNGNKLILTSYGMSVLYSPFFFIAHLVALKSEKFEANGYSLPYEFALNMSSVFYLIIGLLVLRILLLKYFKDWIVALSIFAIVSGTNLTFFATYKAAMPHVYNFTFITVFILAVFHWYKSPTYWKTIVLGFLLGFIILLRPTNILVTLILFFWDIKSIREVRDRIIFFFKRFDLVLIIGIAVIVVWIPQFIYWEFVTGQWFFYSYGAENARFFWSNPQILEILFSFKKGWFVYTPIMFLSVVGILFLRKYVRQAFLPVLIFTLLNIYVQSCWWCWWFGGGFSMRIFIDSYGLLALPLAAFIEYSSGKNILKYAFPVVLIALISLNLFQSKQFINNAIHYYWNNKELYCLNFFKSKPVENFMDYVVFPDYFSAKSGIYKSMKPEEFFRKRLKVTYRDDYLNELIKKKNLVEELKQNHNFSDKEIYSSLSKYASAKVNLNISDSISSIKDEIIENKEWLYFIKKESKNRNISVDSVLNLEIQHIIDVEL